MCRLRPHENLNFHSITPQGDGNEVPDVLVYVLLRSFTPLPRKGTETNPVSASDFEKLAFTPLPRKGTETDSQLRYS